MILGFRADDLLALSLIRNLSFSGPPVHPSSEKKDIGFHLGIPAAVLLGNRFRLESDDVFEAFLIVSLGRVGENHGKLIFQL